MEREICFTLKKKKRRLFFGREEVIQNVSIRMPPSYSKSSLTELVSLQCGLLKVEFKMLRAKRTFDIEMKLGNKLVLGPILPPFKKLNRQKHPEA